MRRAVPRSTAAALYLTQLALVGLFAAVVRYDHQGTPERAAQLENDSVRQYYPRYNWLGADAVNCDGAVATEQVGRLSAAGRHQRISANVGHGLKRRRGKRVGIALPLAYPVFGMAFGFLQGGLLCAFLAFCSYDSSADSADKHNSVHPAIGGWPQDKNPIYRHYAMFQDIHVMVVVGFGFLMVFLRKYGYSSVGFTLLITAVLIQWAILCQGFLNQSSADDGKIHIGIISMIEADVATAAVLISMGAVLGRTTPLQLLIMGLLEIVLYSVNAYLCDTQFQIADVGGSMVVHVFGAYFGLAVSRVLGPPPTFGTVQHPDETSSYVSDILAMIGTTFLWMFWPSFNGALAVGHFQHRAVLNTYLALTASCVSAMATSGLVGSNGSIGRLKMVHVQNATLAGGVAVGSVADLMLTPGGALGVGTAAGILAVLGYSHLQPFLLRRIRLHDTCGVHNLHGMPGIFSGVLSAVMAVIADYNSYSNSLYSVYPARAPLENSTERQNLLDETDVTPGLERSAGGQAGYQMLALASSLGFGLVGGAFTGFILKQERLLRQVSRKDVFGDALHWVLADDASSGTVHVEAAVAKDAVVSPRSEDAAGQARSDEAAPKPALVSTLTVQIPPAILAVPLPNDPQS